MGVSGVQVARAEFDDTDAYHVIMRMHIHHV